MGIYGNHNLIRGQRSGNQHQIHTHDSVSDLKKHSIGTCERQNRSLAVFEWAQSPSAKKSHFAKHKGGGVGSITKGKTVESRKNDGT